MNAQYRNHAFVDGAYLRHLARDHSVDLPNPRELVSNAIARSPLMEWCRSPISANAVALDRLTYYDAQPDEPEPIPAHLRSYWKAIELLFDTDLGFGSVRGRPRRQKGVDTLIAVDMLSGAFDRTFNVAILVAGDADFVPVVQEVKRRGAMVGLVAESSAADELKRAVDRVSLLQEFGNPSQFPALKGPEGSTWPSK